MERVGRVAGVAPQLQGLPAIRVQVFAMPVMQQQQALASAGLCHASYIGMRIFNMHAAYMNKSERNGIMDCSAI